MLNPNPAFLLVKKLKSVPRALQVGVNADITKKLFNLPPKLLINAERYGLVLAPQGWKKKKDTIKFGRPICNPWDQCCSIY